MNKSLKTTFRVTDILTKKNSHSQINCLNSNIQQLIYRFFVYQPVLMKLFFSIFHIGHIDILYSTGEPN
jgi:hypothetical protein